MYDGNPNINEKGYIYAKWKVAPNTYMIGYHGTMYAYLFIGTEKALLIDTFYGEGNLRQFVEDLAGMPVMVANTHGHFDHTGGNAYWEHVYISAEGQKDMKVALGEEHKKAFLAMPHPDYTATTIGDGYVFDLGGRTVEVIDIPCHHPGSVAFLDSQTGFLCSGDELEPGQVLLGSGGPDKIAKHKRNMEKLYKRIDEIKFVCPAHNGSPCDPELISDYIELDTRILNGTAQIMPNMAGFGYGPKPRKFRPEDPDQVRAQYGGASICYAPWDK